MNIVIIGTGNVAYHIADSFKNNSKLNLFQAFNHSKSKDAKNYSKYFECDLVTSYDAIDRNADLYIIAVKDDAIVEVVKNLIPLKFHGMVIHTSGSVDLMALKNVASSTGVFYPLQTFYKGAEINWKTTPVLLEANSKSGLNRLQKIASAISGNVKVMDSKSRLQVHLAAVFACNFTNALYASAYEIIQKNLSKKDTNLLQPIILHSFQKLQKVQPKKAQTGPAMRNDQTVIQKHLTLLKNEKQLSQVYKLLSDLIITQQNSK
ncbi:MAG: DUF2520 domain-containing protein [Burkholderiales bacterium]|nr:DUF2520 domain-containing protein [Bacteroidia bacterium]